MTEILLIILILIVIINLLIILFRKQNVEIKPQLKEVEDSIIRFESTLDRTEKSIRDEFQRNRTETSEIAKSNRLELTKSLESFESKFTENIKQLNDLLRQKFSDFSSQQTEINKQTTENVKEVKQSVENQLKSIREDNTKQLDEMRRTVDEKLQKTLNERLSQSFETVGKQLQAVQEGLGEMKNLAADVGGLKKVLSNVKMRGGIGEIQLSMLLEQILAPDQYEANVKTKSGSSDQVEFAIKLPGKDDTGKNVWLPVDAKFPKDIYEQLQEAYEEGDQVKILAAQKNLDNTIKKMAKDIGEKYLDPPDTTDFGIMFLPFEGIYAEVVRKAALLEDLQRNYKIIVTGPSTLAAILNSLQMGFRTLAIQKRSSEVWQILGAVKKEFESFGGLLGKAQKSIQTGLNHLDDVMGKRTRAIQKKLKSVEALSDKDSRSILPEITDDLLPADDEEDESDESEQ
ncbi:MAG: DNA recombination protein RmuC [Bacteroidetes bacterium]|nr:DNA recombination protein RmuC [Bacteroidota bacterium]